MSESTGNYRNIFKIVNTPDKYLYIYKYCTGWPFFISRDPIGPHKYEKRLTQVEYFKRIIAGKYATEVLLTIPKLLPDNKLNQLITNLEIELHILGYPIFHHTSGLRLRYDIEALTNPLTPSATSSPTIPQATPPSPEVISTRKLRKVSTPIVEELCPHLLELPIKQEDQILIDAVLKETDRIINKAAKNREAVKKATQPKPVEALEQLNEIIQEETVNVSKIDSLLQQTPYGVQ